MLRKNKLHIKITRGKRKIKNFLKKHKIYVFLLILFLFFGYLTLFFYNKYINNPENIVDSIFFDKELVNNPNLGKLISKTNNILSGTNTAKNKLLEYKNEKQIIKNDFPFISGVNIEILSKKSLKVSFSFNKPKLIFIGSGELFALYGNKNFIQKFDINYISGLNLISNNQIYLPSYINTDNNLTNIFWKNNEEKLIKYIKGIKKKFPKGKIFYIVGGENLKVLEDNKTIYFSLNKDLDKQIYQLDLIKKQKQDLYKNATVIDVGNLDEGIYIKQGK